MLTSASCVAGALPADLHFVPLGDDTPVAVRWMIAGQDADSSGMDDWAVLVLEHSAPTPDVGARRLWRRAPRPSVDTPLWWAAVTPNGEQMENGLCRVQQLVSVAQDLDYELVHHDCALSRSAPGVLLYELEDEAAPRAIAFQGSAEFAVTIDAFSEAPVPARDALVTSETFLGFETPLLVAVDPQGRASERRSIEGTWLNWASRAQLPELVVRMDGAARSHEFLGLELVRVWVLDEPGQLYAYSLANERLHPIDGPSQGAAFVDVSVPSASTAGGAVFAVTREGSLCARPDTTQEAAWVCTAVGAGASALDATQMAGGYLAVVARDDSLTACSFTDGAWQAPFELAADGGHRQVTANTTPQGTLYVVTTHFERMRIRVADFEAANWSSWTPLHTGSLPTAVTALDSGRDHFEQEIIHAVAGGEILLSRELTQGSLDSWQARPESPPEFGAWQRLRGVNHPQR